MQSAAELRALAERAERIELLAGAARDAKQRYAAAPGDPSLRASHRAASQALAEARQAMRAEGTEG